jgi:hypothetical protein
MEITDVDEISPWFKIYQSLFSVFVLGCGESYISRRCLLICAPTRFRFLLDNCAMWSTTRRYLMYCAFGSGRYTKFIWGNKKNANWGKLDTEELEKLTWPCFAGKVRSVFNHDSEMERHVLLSHYLTVAMKWSCQVLVFFKPGALLFIKIEKES